MIMAHLGACFTDHKCTWTRGMSPSINPPATVPFDIATSPGSTRCRALVLGLKALPKRKTRMTFALHVGSFSQERMMCSERTIMCGVSRQLTTGARHIIMKGFKVWNNRLFIKPKLSITP